MNACIPRPIVGIVTPAWADANNGNWQTARRWARMLSAHYQVTLLAQWPDARISSAPDMLIVLHARRCAPSIAAWSDQYPKKPLLLALTGTDLYRDIQYDASAQQSLALAHRLIVLQEAGPQQLPPAYQNKCSVIFQSCTSRKPLTKTHQRLNVVVVGHLRDEKTPQTVFEITKALSPGDGIRIKHIGAALDPALGEIAKATAQHHTHYHWLGGVTHMQARHYIQRAHVLLHPSRMEGGAHVIMEAITSGTAVIASDVAGNIGMLGSDYCGLFKWGQSAQASSLLTQCYQSLSMGLNDPNNFLARLTAQCHQRAHLFTPAIEAAALNALVSQALNESL
jgi:putative glycosyltransferase (TIGR04348 family)